MERCSVLALLLVALVSGAIAGEPSAADTANTVATAVNDAAKKADKTVDEHMKNVNSDPGNLITKQAMTKILQGSSFLPQKAGTRSVSLEASQGFNGFTNYQPSGWKITETMSGPDTKKEESKGASEPAYNYPSGLGPVLINVCTERNYSKTSPCFNSKTMTITRCIGLMDAAAFIGVGFDGRGYYSSVSRRASLVQRVCANKAEFMGQSVPDTMNVFGIFETTAETKSFQTASEYMRYIRHKAGLSNQKNLFSSEASKYSRSSAVGFNGGAVGAIAGTAIGAYAGGPVGASIGASLGSAVGGSLNAGSGSGKGSSSESEKQSQSSKTELSGEQSQSNSASQSFFAIMYINVILFEITLDEVKPTDLSLSVLKDYMSLPSSYYSVGADVKYQNFLLRYGTHFIRSGKFGGQLKVTKTLKTSRSMSSQQFARISESEFQSMFATLQSKVTQKSSGGSFLGFGAKSQSTKQKAEAKGTAKSESKSSEDVKSSQAFQQSQFTQTTVEAQGGTSEIAEALMDFYTPSFKQLFHDWLVSIKDFAKPFEFQLKAMHDLFYMSMKDLFPAGSTNFGCVGEGKSDAKIQVEAKTGKRFYIDTRVIEQNGTTVEQKIRVDCKFNSLEDFEKSLERRRMSLEKAIGVYMVEGPFPTSSFDLPAGETGCEEGTIGSLESFKSSGASLKFSDLKSAPFLLAFDMPAEIPSVASSESKFKMVMRDNMWFAVDPKAELIHLYDGCQVYESKETKVCFRNIILTFDEKSGFFHVDRKDFAASKRRMPSLPNWLSGSTVARARRLVSAANVQRSVQAKEISVPCNVKWLNSHRLDPSRSDNCIHFTAATEGDIFVVFAAIPKNHHTWYYLQISPEGVAFYQGMKLHKRDVEEGMGVLGNANLYQSFFVCVAQKNSSVIMQYGKADPDSEVGTVYSGYEYPARSKFSRLSFYSFGSGEKSVSLMDIRLTKQLPKVECWNSNYIKKDYHCVLNCHAECNGCRQAKNSKACHQCAHARVERGTGVNKEVECVAQCPPGMQLSGSSSSGLCVPCTAGKFKAAAGNHTCGPCPRGTFSPAGAKACHPCSPGAYNDKEGQSQCFSCQAGRYSSASGATSCAQCPNGHFSTTGQSSCSPCAYGHYGDRVGLAACTPCPAGRYADQRGQQACKTCPTGTSSSSGSRSCANSCPMGQFSPSKGVACRACPAGSFAESAGSSSCSKCRPGTYQTRTGQAACTPAPKGAYVSTAGATSVAKCRAGTFNDKTGQTSDSACKPCPAGRFSAAAGASSCSPCAAGTFQSSRGQTRCQQATPGHYADVAGLAQQKNCRAGTFSSANAAKTCRVCPRGSVSARPGSSSCSKCPAGQYSQYDGLLVCTRCRKGYQAPAVGSASCSKCSVGHFSASEGTSRCATCSAGYFASATGATACSRCNAGSHSSAGASRCTTCPAGQYSSATGASRCTSCPAGQYSSSSGASRCTSCPAGQYSSSSGASRCTSCPAGQYSSSSGATRCTSCSRGYYASSTGSRGCARCPQNTYASSTGSRSCSSCSSSQYTSSTGSTYCSSCSLSVNNPRCNGYYFQSRYVGCYYGGEVNNRQSGGDGSQRNCFNRCNSQGYAYFGLQGGRYCYCGHSIGGSGRSSSQCNYNCRDDSSAKCGGSSTKSVFKTDVLTWLRSRSKGCYEDHGWPRRIFTKGDTKSNKMTVTMCYRYCKDRNRNYFGVESANQCYCGNSLSGSRRSGCTYRCKGDSRQTCGGNWRLDVYKIK